MTPVDQSASNNEPPPVRELIDEICDRYGPRPAGSAAEHDTANFLGDRLTGWNIEPIVERFRVAPRVLQIAIGASTLGYSVAYALYFLWPVVSFALLSTLFLIMAAPRGTGRDPLEALLPKKSSPNVFGRVEPRGERKQIVVFSGHHDSAFRMPFLRHHAFYPLLTVIAVVLLVAVLMLWGVSFWRTLNGGALSADLPVRAGWEFWALVFCGLGAVLGIFMSFGMLRRDAVLGANDNLSATAVAWEVGRRLAEQPPKHVEVWLVSYGSEEAGLKGSRAFVRAHRQELEGALVVNMECVGQSGTLNILTGELITATLHSGRAIELVEQAAASESIPVKRMFLLPGLTDATSFNRRGIAATTVIRFNDAGYLDYYHNPEDAPEAISEESLQEALSLCLAVVRLLDRDAAAQ